ncbi:BQ2448_5339 [Microbotryum intermedium]|uniref:BQ2448_5339 protein n=1 Tax=Microbotryum intermedium TaxID=269621 RepID=A0A238F977_9BASI|nr:BQ2448_5339 [Microbotryum intermedium]
MAPSSKQQPFATAAIDTALVSSSGTAGLSPSESSDPNNYSNNMYMNPEAGFDDEYRTSAGSAGEAVIAPAGLVQPIGTNQPPMVLFDPRASPLSDDDDSDGEGSNPRPKKRKSQGNLRATASMQSLKSAAGDDEDKSRRKIQIEYIEEKSKRHITFSKRKAGIMKKAYELSTLTGTQVLLLVVSESGWVYTFTTDKFKPLVKEDDNGQLSQGQKLIAACLEAKESGSPPLPSHPTYQPTSSSGNFEANSATHGGQIALKANPRISSQSRPIASNRRVSSKGRNHIPTAIRIGHDPNVPPVPHLPTPMTSGGNGGSYMDQPLTSPISPHGPRSLSHPPPSPAGRGMHHMQHQQAQAMLGAGHRPSQSDYADMFQRAEGMHMGASSYDPYGSSNPNMSSGMGYGGHSGASAHPMSDSAYELYGGHYTHQPEMYQQSGAPQRPGSFQNRSHSVSSAGGQSNGYLADDYAIRDSRARMEQLFGMVGTP